MDNPSQILNPECVIPKLEINQAKYDDSFSCESWNKAKPLAPVPSGTEHLILKNIIVDDITTYGPCLRQLPMSICIIDIDEFILDYSQDELDNLPYSLGLLRVIISESLLDFVKNFRDKEQDVYYFENLRNVQNIIKIMDGLKLPLECMWNYLAE